MRPGNEANISRRLRLGEGCPYRLVKLDLLLQVLLHDPVVVIDTIAMEVVHLGCGVRGWETNKGEGRHSVSQVSCYTERHLSDFTLGVTL